MVGLEHDQNPVFKSPPLPMCVSLFLVSRSCALKIKYLSGETVKDVEKRKGRFVGVLSNSFTLSFHVLFYSLENCGKLRIIQMILAHGSGKY